MSDLCYIGTISKCRDVTTTKQGILCRTPESEGVALIEQPPASRVSQRERASTNSIADGREEDEEKRGTDECTAHNPPRCAGQDGHKKFDSKQKDKNTSHKRLLKTFTP